MKRHFLAWLTVCLVVLNVSCMSNPNSDESVESTEIILNADVDVRQLEIVFTSLESIKDSYYSIIKKVEERIIKLKSDLNECVINGGSYKNQPSPNREQKDISCKVAVDNKESIIKELKAQIKIKDDEIARLESAECKESGQRKVTPYENFPTNCLPFANSTFIHFITAPGIPYIFPVPCESSPDDSLDGGWLVVQRRRDFTENFNRSWTEYKDGFGNLENDFFLGLEKIYSITKYQKFELYVYLQDDDGNESHMWYSDFKLGSEREDYQLQKIGEFSGTSNGLRENLYQKFTTFDRDNDFLYNQNCAAIHGGGWWFNNCGASSLNGFPNVIWPDWEDRAVRLTQMMIRPSKSNSDSIESFD